MGRYVVRRKPVGKSEHRLSSVTHGLSFEVEELHVINERSTVPTSVAYGVVNRAMRKLGNEGGFGSLDCVKIHESELVRTVARGTGFSYSAVRAVIVQIRCFSVNE
jgi:hypothetical protein